jgi:hypothetical protein
MALYPFKLLYESNMGTGGMLDGKVNQLLVDQGQAIVFCISFLSGWWFKLHYQ